ncbi:MAG: DUF4386 domain-containing protein [Bacteroidota bacterium]
MNSQNKIARLAGLLYLLLVLTGIFTLVYIPGKFIDWDSAMNTLEKVQGNEVLFKWGIVSEALMLLSFIFLLLVLYQLLHKVSKPYAVVMVILGMVSIPVSFANLAPKFSILSLAGGENYLADLSLAQKASWVLFHFEKYYAGINIAQIFWGLWLFPFGYLVYKSGFLPKFLGFFLMLGCFGYLTAFVGGLFFEEYHSTTFADIVGIPDSIGEIGICLWLLVMGTNTFSKKGPR